MSTRKVLTFTYEKSKSKNVSMSISNPVDNPNVFIINRFVVAFQNLVRRDEQFFTGLGVYNLKSVRTEQVETIEHEYE